MNEWAMIREMAARFRRSPDQANALFESDAELVAIGGETWALTLDDFSPQEDLFSLDSPELTGANLATATLSDLLAAGADPAFYMQAVSLPHDVSNAVIRGLMDGVRSVLDRAGCFLCGGDTGLSDPWRYCGFAMGPAAAPLTRRLPTLPQALWITGQLGDANLAAFRNEPPPPFELRLSESRLLRAHATACMDTSGGLMESLWTLHSLNPGMRWDLDLAAIPLAPAVLAFTQASDIPSVAALLGGAGEYELLAMAPVKGETVRLQEWREKGLTRIGEVTPSAESGIFLHGKNGRPRLFFGPPPCPRAAGRKEYREAVVRLAFQLAGDGGR
ncbi:MAG: AIR synthase related protein [Kiritimatiellia bacterium]